MLRTASPPQPLLQMCAQQYEYDGWTYEKLRAQRNRAHFLLTEPYRYVTVILSTKRGEEKKLYCIDSPCYHASGPLGEGELLEIEDMLCVSCPWHRFLVSLDDGREVFLDVDPTASEGDASGEAAEGQVGRHGKPSAQLPFPTYPLKGPDPNGPGVTVERGKCVQRTHRAWLNESTGVLTIEVAAAEEMKKAPVRSDKPATSVKDGAMCMQIFDIKAKGL